MAVVDLLIKELENCFEKLSLTHWNRYSFIVINIEFIGISLGKIKQKSPNTSDEDTIWRGYWWYESNTNGSFCYQVPSHHCKTPRLFKISNTRHKPCNILSTNRSDYPNYGAQVTVEMDIIITVKHKTNEKDIGHANKKINTKNSTKSEVIDVTKFPLYITWPSYVLQEQGYQL